MNDLLGLPSRRTMEGKIRVCSEDKIHRSWCPRFMRDLRTWSVDGRGLLWEFRGPGTFTPNVTEFKGEKEFPRRSLCHLAGSHGIQAYKESP